MFSAAKARERARARLVPLQKNASRTSLFARTITSLSRVSSRACVVQQEKVNKGTFNTKKRVMKKNAVL